MTERSSTRRWPGSVFALESASCQPALSGNIRIGSLWPPHEGSSKLRFISVPLPCSRQANCRLAACAPQTPRQKPCAGEGSRHYSYRSRCGCSSVVEHLLAKEDVASSSLVTRSSLGEGGPRGEPSYGWQASQITYAAPTRSPHEDAVRLSLKIEISSERAVCRMHNRSETANSRPQPRPFAAYAKFTPWELVAYFAFTEKEKAAAFEKYLKSGSGRAFAIRHFY